MEGVMNPLQNDPKSWSARLIAGTFRNPTHEGVGVP